MESKDEAFNAVVEPATSKAGPTGNFHSISQLYFIVTRAGVFSTDVEE